jgi:hypothetical protein
MEGNVSVQDDCVKKCNKESTCPAQEWCLVSDEDSKEGGCDKAEILNCKEWKNGIAEEKCETCVDGFTINSEGTECKVDQAGKEAGKGRMLEMQVGRFDRIFQVSGGED